MPDTITKPWYKSKAVWTAIVTAMVAAYNSLTASFGWPVIPDFVYGILAALGVYSRVVATTVIK